MTDFAATPVLENDRVRLEPLSTEHAPQLRAAVAEGDLWRTWYTRIPSPAAMADEIDARLAKQRAGALAPWAVIDRASGVAVGMTTYLHLNPADRRLEIGSTWLARSAQGSGMNPAAKALLFERAFDVLDCVAVELRTHWHNHQSRAAIARLGAKQDGVLRNHELWHDGTLRDTVVFSVISSEWPTVRAGLEHRLRTR